MVLARDEGGDKHTVSDILWVKCLHPARRRVNEIDTCKIFE